MEGDRAGLSPAQMDRATGAMVGLALPPTIEDSSDEDGGEVHRCYRMLLAGLERTADLPLASLKRAGDQRG